MSDPHRRVICIARGFPFGGIVFKEFGARPLYMHRLAGSALERCDRAIRRASMNCTGPIAVGFPGQQTDFTHDVRLLLVFLRFLLGGVGLASS